MPVSSKPLPFPSTKQRVEIQTLSGLRKAAIFLASVGDEVSAQIIRQLSDEEVRKISLEVSRLSTVSPEHAEIVLNEFCARIDGGLALPMGGSTFARKMLIGAFGEESGGKLLEEVTASATQNIANVSALRKADPQRLANFIQNEHPQTIALVLSHLDHSHAATMLTTLSPELRAEVAFRMANLDRISPEVFNRIAAVVEDKLKGGGEAATPLGGVRSVAEILNGIDSEAAEEILAGIAERDQSFADTIRQLMFVFEDLLVVDAQGIKTLLGKVDRKVLTMALKGTSEQLKAHFMQGMSQRGAEMLKEDMEALGAVKLKEVESARQQVLTMVNQLRDEGVLNVKGAEADQYVV